MLRKLGSSVIFLLLAGLAATFSARGDAPLTVISQPSAAYKAATTKIDISAIKDGTSDDEISGGGLTVTFNTTMDKLSVPDTWGTWNSPPATESKTPPILFSDGFSSILMGLSMPEKTFGFEAQPDLSDNEKLTATFFDSSDKTIGSITLTVSGNAGALLFAGSSNTPISSVTLTDLSGRDFAIANVRFANTPFVPTPEPAAFVLEPLAILLVGGGLAWIGRRSPSRS